MATFSKIISWRNGDRVGLCFIGCFRLTLFSHASYVFYLSVLLQTLLWTCCGHCNSFAHWKDWGLFFFLFFLDWHQNAQQAAEEYPSFLLCLLLRCLVGCAGSKLDRLFLASLFPQNLPLHSQECPNEMTRITLFGPTYHKTGSVSITISAFVTIQHPRP